MSVAPASAAKIKRLTREQCAEWAANPTTNPVTGRSIEVGKATYEAIAERCKDAFDVVPGAPGAPGAAGPSRPRPRPRKLPKTYKGHRVPQTAEEWRNSDIRARGLRLYEACRRFGFISEDYVRIAKEFGDIVGMLQDHEILPEADAPLVARAIAYVGHLMATPDAVRDWRRLPRSAYEHTQQIKSDIMALLSGLPASGLVTRHDLELTMFAEMANFGTTERGERALDQLIAAEALEQEIVLMRAPAPTDADDAYALPASRERSLPESISQRRVKQRKPKARAEDPDEFYPWSATEEDAPTDRSRFRSHAKLSAVSPGPAPSPDAAPLAPLTPKKRTALLAELREACTVMRDMISMQRFDRMNKKALQLVVRLGPKGAGQQRCYYVRNAYQLWANAAKEGQTFKDPLTRAPITDAEKDDILRKIRHVRPNAPDPRAHAVPRDPKLALDIQQVWASTEVIIATSPTTTPPPLSPGDSRVGFYRLQVTRPVGPTTYIISDLGYVPSEIQLGDVGGDANLTSAAVIASLRDLFDRGRLMASNVPPYRCCRIHLRKPMHYWLAKRTPASPTAGRINLRLWKAFATEVYGAL